MSIDGSADAKTGARPPARRALGRGSGILDVPA